MSKENGYRTAREFNREFTDPPGHHWILESSNSGAKKRVVGTCLRCDQIKTFPRTIEDTEKYRKPTASARSRIYKVK